MATILKETKKFTELNFENRTFKFEDEFIVDVEKVSRGKKTYYRIYNEKLNVIGLGMDYNTALIDFMEYIVDLWDTYAIEVNEKLSDDALLLKVKILNTYREIKINECEGEK